ncbi:DNA repair protein RecO [Dendrosporobacter sp. 1207_IL3150]|uniref:DNA repair protein RecO n=1 Tax=Dendrosporobacter sp. 1207_IL3150 TaxID=3084054 RepID=UPI002FD8D1FA
MSQYSTEAILLAVRNWGEADRMVTLFSREYGKIAAIAYGCRRPRSGLAGAIQAFNQVELSITPGKALDTIKQCEIKHSFKQIREDLNIMSYAAFINELVVEFCPERQPEPHIYDLLLSAFSLISSRNPRLVASAAAWQLLTLAGYQPNLDNCVICGQNLTDKAFFSLDKGGSVCEKCDNNKLLGFDLSVRTFITNLMSIDWDNPQSFSINAATLIQSEKILTNYLSYLLGKPLNSLEFIKQIHI